MKVDAARQRLVLELADADAALSRLEHRARSLPEDVELAEANSLLESARDDQVRAEMAAEDLGREYRRIDGEITGMRDREAKDSALLSGGGLAAKALSELQHELSGLGRRRAIIEDELIAIMEQQEALGAEAERASATIAHLTQQIAATQARRDEAMAGLDADLKIAAARRDEVAGEVPPELVAIYDKQRAAGRVGAGLLRARRCGGCRMELDRGTVASIAAADPDEVIRCDECGAILVRTSESGLAG